MLSTEQLRAQAQKLLEQAEELERQEKATAIQEVVAFMQKKGVSQEDLLAKLGVKQSARGGPKGAVQPKYRDPQSGQTWAGRGHQPKWFKEALASGKKPEDFLMTPASKPSPAAKSAGGKAKKKRSKANS